MHDLKASIVIPAHNEAQNILQTYTELRDAFAEREIPYEIIIVNDNSEDDTGEVIQDIVAADSCVKTLDRESPAGFGRAIRAGLELVEGDAVIVYMADRSDDPKDAVKYYEKMEEGYDCVFGSRFRKESKVENYPWFKLIANRVVNRCIQLMFFCGFNDLTNAFKGYRSYVLQECGPFRASHFNITIEMSLSALIRKYNIAEVPISWYGRTWGSSSLRLSEMGRRYLHVLLKIYLERVFISDDVMQERLSQGAKRRSENVDLRKRIDALERKVAEIKEERPDSEPRTPPVA
jgi:dolichol-phosphate mannosyltransferase